LCQRLVEAHEAKIKRRYDWVVRQRIDTLGCTPSPAIASPLRHKIILVSYARCGWAADNWAWMSRDVLDVYGARAASVSPFDLRWRTLLTRLRGDGVWARVRHRRGSRAVKGIVEQEAGLGHELLRNAISVWTPASGPVQKSIP